MLIIYIIYLFKIPGTCAARKPGLFFTGGYAKIFQGNGFFTGTRMPQVAARLSVEHEQWLKLNFRTKGAGAEFIIPWVAESFMRAQTAYRALFSDPELKTIIMAHKDARLLAEHARAPFLLMRVINACELYLIHTRFAASRTTLEAKLKKMDDVQAAALAVWAAAFWTSRTASDASLDEYVRAL